MVHTQAPVLSSPTPNVDLLIAQQSLLEAARLALPDLTELNTLKKAGLGRLSPGFLTIQERPAMIAYYDALMRVELATTGRQDTHPRA